MLDVLVIFSGTVAVFISFSVVTNALAMQAARVCLGSQCRRGHSHDSTEDVAGGLRWSQRITLHAEKSGSGVRL